MILHPASRSRRFGIPALSSGDRIGTSLGQRLEDAYHWFRSVAPGDLEPIDAIVVGPGGTYAVSVAGERGRFARRNGHWYRWNRSTDSWIPWDPVPITAARLSGRRLSLYLERAGLSAAVDAVLVPPRDMEVLADATDPFGVTVERDPERLATLVSAQERLSQAQVDRIVALLDPRQPLPQLARATPHG